jgi:hypothetical protein
MSAEVITAIISAVTTLLVFIGTWHVTMRQYRQKNSEMVTKAIDEVKDTVTANNADIQQHLAVIDFKIETLSTRVDKHNQVVDRTIALERDVAVQTEQIKVANHRIDDLERLA